ncbi:Zona pellucida sperm-binding protein 1 Zona pellucida glycoprotein 1 [Larimichthys crocea]|uniref:Zona pellucida sperm-binding protein 1 Zona pellucida glycoprotein 1 n=1 Tax=Larimichthys crocea TaxID=215358 RepID=A0A6G0HRS6_LARCR|nr:Zona pellucida sperm-binding protein 1 Zona pellucida glycoprotein 1 [Larimichthys crocea]
MAAFRFELLLAVVYLIGTLLLASARGWQPIDETQLLNMYATGGWVKPDIVSGDSHLDDRDEGIPEYALPETEGGASSNPFANHGFQEAADSSQSNWASGSGSSGVEFVDSGFELEFEDAPPRSWTSATDSRFEVDFEDTPPSSWTSGTDGGFEVDFEDAPPRSWTSSIDDGFEVEFEDAPPRSWTSSTSRSSSELGVVCSDFGFQITLPSGPLSEVKILGSNELLSVTDAPASCGYKVNSLKNTLTVPFTGCHVKPGGGCYANSYSMQLLYVDDFDQTQVATASCEGGKGKFNRGLLPRAQPAFKCSPTPPPTPSKAQNCAVTAGERVTCGSSGISSSDCEKMGCCVDLSTSACYFPLDECTGDHHFVFAIRYNSASIPVDPTKLVIPGNANCKPVLVNDKVAIFKFKITECGTRVYDVGETKVYLAEVQTIVKALNLKYGVITRSSPLRFMVECRYSKTGAAQQSMATVGVMVKTPTSILPTSVSSAGLFAVQLRIAKDNTYSSYLPTYHQPLRLLLGKPVYLELRLKSPKPDAVILVNYCLAYPRSAKNALVLIYEGCRNPYEPNVSILQVSGSPKNRHQRRFMVTAFQFMEQTTNKYLDEEIYFMCSAEVCRPTEKTCEERCFDGKAP